MVTFSIIIPHHNIPLLLQRCLNSIPDTPEIQVIVVDDNSSLDKVDFNNFPGKDRKYTTIIFDKKGGGAGHARNVGMKQALGKWLVFVDADDFLVDDAYDILEKHKDDGKDVIYFKTGSVDSDTYEPSDRHIKINKAIDDAISGVISSKKAVLAVPSPISKMLRREHIQGKGILFDETYAANDMMFAFKAVHWADDDAVAVNNEVLYMITSRAGSLDAMKKTSPRNFLSFLEVLIRCNQFIKDTSYDKYLIILQVFRAWKISPSTFWKALKLAVKERALFSGISIIFKKLFKK
jgi:glycosyltransferase involved in cell wall biosynthesis